jgi:hypothetical protein
MSDSDVTRPQVWLPTRAGSGTHQALYREFMARLDNLHLEPGDILTVTLRPEVYDSRAGYRLAEQFCQQLANLVKQETGRIHEVLILKDGTEVGVRKVAQPAVRVEQLE